MYDWATMLCSRNRHDTVSQLHSNKKKKKKRKEKKEGTQATAKLPKSRCELWP